MDFSWTPEQIELRDRIVEFAQSSLNDANRERDRSEEFNRRGFELCAEFGIQSMAVPAAYNASGIDTDLVTAALAMEAIGYGCRDNGLSMALAAHMWTVQRPIAEYGSEDQKQRFLPPLTAGELIGAHALTEPDAGSDNMAMQTTATPTDATVSAAAIDALPSRRRLLRTWEVAGSAWVSLAMVYLHRLR